MHPNENLGNVVSTPLLNGTNYHSWSRSIAVVLHSNDKLHFINGALSPPPDEGRNSIAWGRRNTMVMAWLNNSVEPEISQSILWIDISEFL